MTALVTTGATLRKLWAGDRARFRDHLLRLDPTGRHQRFAMSASDDFVSGYAERSFHLDSVIHGWFADGELRGAGELRLIGGAKREAEMAFSVENAWQGRGIGTELMNRTLLAARNRGMRRLYVNCLASNRHMQRLARRFGGELEYESGDVIGLLLPPAPSVGSVMKEVMSDGHGLVSAVFDLQRRLLGAA